MDINDVIETLNSDNNSIYVDARYIAPNRGVILNYDILYHVDVSNLTVGGIESKPKVYIEEDV